MKRSVLIILVFLLALSLIPAKSRTKSFGIQGGYGDVTEIIVEPIPSQTQAYLMGMPFNIEDRQVQYGATESGRLIANWSMLTNIPGEIKLTVSAGKLLHTTMKSTPLDYELRFFYRLGYYAPNDDLIDTGDSAVLVYSTADGESATFSLFSSEVKDASYIGSIDGSIYFMFTQESSAMIRPEDGTANYQEVGDEPFFPGGAYRAEVTLKLEVGE